MSRWRMPAKMSTTAMLCVQVGYNHYVGRLGLKMPETARIISLHWPDW